MADVPAPGPRVWVDDVNPIFCRGVAACLGSGGYEVAGEGTGFQPEPPLERGDVLVFGVDERRLAAAVALSRRCDGARLVGIVGDASEEQLYELLTAGLAGVLVRSTLTPRRLISCLDAVVSGQGAVPPELLGQLIDGLSRGAPRGARASALASRELSVLRHLAEGESTREIAEHLSYSERTVKNIVRDVLLKLDCRTRAHAVATATRQGVI